MVLTLKHCIPSVLDLSSSFRMDSMAFLYWRNQVAALLGSVSVKGWVDFMIPSQKLRWVRRLPNAFSKIVQALSTESTPSGGMRFAAFPVRASRSFSNWFVFDILLSSAAFSNLSLNVMKSSLGLPEYLGICCRHGLADRSENKPCFLSASSMLAILVGIRSWCWLLSLRRERHCM